MDAKTSMYQFLAKRLDRNDNSKILNFEGKPLRVNKFLEQIDIMSENLCDAGIKKGDVVAINLPNIINAIVVFYAVNKCGAVANIMHPLLPIKKVISIMEDTNTSFFITFDDYYIKSKAEIDNLKIAKWICKISDYLPLVKKLFYSTNEPVIEDKTICYNNLLKKKRSEYSQSVYNEDAVYLHSGGTTGESKTICLSNEAFNNLADDLSFVIPNLDRKHNKCAMVLPLFHGFGLGVCMHAMVAYGFETFVMPRFSTKKFADITCKNKITISAGVPLMYEKLMKLTDKQFAKLRYMENIFVGGDKLNDTLKKKFDSRLQEFGCNAELLEGYGLTETVTVCCVNKPNDFEVNSVGYPLKGLGIAIIDEDNQLLTYGNKGEICVTGNTLMSGYLNDTELKSFIEFDGKKYVKTGDLGYLNEKGKLFFLDRIKRTFKISGITVFPSELEKLVNGLPYVTNSVAVLKEKSIHLYVETAVNDNEQVKKQEITELCRQNLLPYAVPKAITFLEAFPRNKIGKIDILALS